MNDIKTRRKQLKISQAKLGKMANISQAYLCAIESGYVKTPDPTILKKIDEALNEFEKKANS